MLSIKNGRFTECVFVDDLKNKSIKFNRYKNQDSDISGLIIKINADNVNGYKIWVDINGYPNIITSFNLHNVESAEIF
jgi:hypothetical protein